MMSGSEKKTDSDKSATLMFYHRDHSMKSIPRKPSLNKCFCHNTKITIPIFKIDVAKRRIVVEQNKKMTPCFSARPWFSPCLYKKVEQAKPQISFGITESFFESIFDRNGNMDVGDSDPSGRGGRNWLKD